MSISYTYLSLLVWSCFVVSYASSRHDNYHVRCVEEERNALLTFKNGLVDPTDRLASWYADNKDCCTWLGISCVNSTGHVDAIHLSGDCVDVGSFQARQQQLKGGITQSLLDLKRLRHLDLSCNNFEGAQVPEFIGSLNSLHYLNLSYSNFTGRVPSELKSLKHLISLNLSRNHLTGKIPEKIGDMLSLESLDLSLNNLSGKLPPSVTRLDHISTFNISYNNLTGRIPASPHIQSLNESNFLGNHLCGVPLNKDEDCVALQSNATAYDGKKHDDGLPWVIRLSLFAGGFIIGFVISIVIYDVRKRDQGSVPRPGHSPGTVVPTGTAGNVS